VKKYLNVKHFFLTRWIISFFDVKRFFSILFFPRYILNLLKYLKLSNKEKIRIWDSYPCLIDRGKHPFDPHYFYQAYWLARNINKYKPKTHVDIASNILMIGVLSGFVDTTFIDYRPLKISTEGFKCKQGDILHLPFSSDSVVSISSLHVIEHVGLGRYGDSLNPQGSELAAKELYRILKPGGLLYISVPVGIEKVCFNAHRIFSPKTVLNMFFKLALIDFSFVDDLGTYYNNSSIEFAEKCEYACGMFIFRKKKIEKNCE